MLLLLLAMPVQASWAWMATAANHGGEGEVMHHADAHAHPATPQADPGEQNSDPYQGNHCSFSHMTGIGLSGDVQLFMPVKAGTVRSFYASAKVRAPPLPRPEKPNWTFAAI